MSAANALNAFMTTRQFRQGEEDRAMALEDRQRAIGLENTRGKINALMMQPGDGTNRATGMDAGFTQGQSAPQPSRMDQARQMAVQSGSSELMGQFQQQLASMDAATREQNAAMFGLVGQVANSLRGVPVTQRGTALMAMAPQLQAAGVPDQEIQNYAQILSDPQSSDAVLEALSSRVLEAQSVFDAYAPQMQAENEVLSRFQNGQQVQGAVNPNARANRALESRGLDISQQNADTSRMNADTSRMEAEGQGGAEWVTLAPDDPRRAGFNDQEVIQYNTRTGQIARRSTGEFGPTDIRQFRTQATALASVRGALDEYENRLGGEVGENGERSGGVGARIIYNPRNPDIAGLEASRTAVFMQLKELFNLGVLTGPDMDIMESAIGDPTGRGAIGQSTEGLLEQLRVVRDYINRAENQIPAQFRAAPGGPARSSANEPSIDATRQREGGNARAQAVQITTGEEYSQLAPGTRYIDPNGVERVKQ
jgi:hypothetical protein